jgi:dolichol-phosphate mannosyltransferase
MQPEHRLSVVVPCFNEAEGIEHAHRRIGAALAGLGASLQLVFVDDGSTDSTWQKLRALSQADARVTAVRLSRNFGHQYAISAGLDYAQGGYVAILDADLQDPPELLPRMLELAQQGFDVVYGRRIRRDGESAFKKLTANLFYRLLDRLSDSEIPRDAGDFRLMSARVVEILRGMPERDRFMRGLVSWLGFRQTALDYEREPRHHGRSKYTLGRMLRLALTGITSFSTAPLRACLYLSYLLFALSMLGIVYVLWSWLALDAVRGWASLASIVLFLGGCNLFFTGILGEYVGRTYLQTKMRPLYLVDEVVNGLSARQSRKIPE